MSFLPHVLLCTLFAMPGNTQAKVAYAEDVLPLLEEYCYDCHGDGADKGGFQLDSETKLPIKEEWKRWDLVEQHLGFQTMPPEEKDQPSQPERELILNWIDEVVFGFDPATITPGQVTLRRLNREEYNNTVRDLLGITTFRPADDFPADDTGYGFDTVADILTMPPVLLEKYLKAAGEIALEAIPVIGGRPTPLSVPLGDFNNDEGGLMVQEEELCYFLSNSTIRQILTFDVPGTHTLSIQAGATMVQGEGAQMKVMIGDKTHEVIVNARPKAPETYEFDHSVDRAGEKVTVAISFTNDFYDPSAGEDRNLILSKVSLIPPEYSSHPLKWKLPLNEMMSSIESAELRDGGYLLSESGKITTLFQPRQPGRYEISVKASGEQNGENGIGISARFTGAEIGTAEVFAERGGEEVYTFAWEQAGGSTTDGLIEVQITNGNSEREVFIQNLELKGPPANPFPQRSWFESAYLPSEDLLPGEENQFIARLVAGFTERAFRRSLAEGEVEQYLKLFHSFRDSGQTLKESLRGVIEAVLVSPHFLFRGEVMTASTASEDGEPRLIGEYELASRLSYFLWSACPDDRLLSLASQEQLRTNLESEVRRMIADPKSEALVRNFLGQWLQLRDLDSAKPSLEAFPGFTDALAFDMRRETELVFTRILQRDLSALELLNSRNTYLNQRLAQHYGVGGEWGEAFELVVLPEETGRRGILGHGSFLTLTSNPTRTSPVKRGKFILENLLGTPPPPAPQNVPAFEEDRAEGSSGTVRERLELHRDDPACSSCHQAMDPLGFALENFDAIGRWRTEEQGQTIDSSGQLLDGVSLAHPSELMAHLGEERGEDFIACLIGKLLTYGVGRGPLYTDRAAIQEIVDETREGEFRFQKLLMGVIQSRPFQMIAPRSVK